MPCDPKFKLRSACVILSSLGSVESAIVPCHALTGLMVLAGIYIV